MKMEFNKTEKILISIIFGLVLVIIVGTIAAKISQKNNAPEVLISKGKAVSLMAPSDTTETAYFELGKMRIITKAEKKADDEPGTVLVVSPWLAYTAGDTVFYEELARKRGLMKGEFQSYFSERTKNQLLSETEDKIESELLENLNSQMALGKITDIYLTDYIFLE